MITNHTVVQECLEKQLVAEIRTDTCMNHFEKIMQILKKKFKKNWCIIASV